MKKPTKPGEKNSFQERPMFDIGDLAPSDPSVGRSFGRVIPINEGKADRMPESESSEVAESAPSTESVAAAPGEELNEVEGAQFSQDDAMDEPPVSIPLPNPRSVSRWAQEEQLRHIERQLGIRSREQRAAKHSPEEDAAARERKFTRIDAAHDGPPESHDAPATKRFEEVESRQEAGIHDGELETDPGALLSVLLSVGLTAITCGGSVAAWATSDPARAGLISVGVPFAIGGGACLLVALGIWGWRQLPEFLTADREEKRRRQILDRIADTPHDGPRPSAKAPIRETSSVAASRNAEDPLSLLHELRQRLESIAKQIDPGKP